jgi:hypothetical protein
MSAPLGRGRVIRTNVTESLSEVMRMALSVAGKHYTDELRSCPWPKLSRSRHLKSSSEPTSGSCADLRSVENWYAVGLCGDRFGSVEPSELPLSWYQFRSDWYPNWYLDR